MGTRRETNSPPSQVGLREAGSDAKPLQGEPAAEGKRIRPASGHPRGAAGIRRDSYPVHYRGVLDGTPGDRAKNCATYRRSHGWQKNRPPDATNTFTCGAERKM